MYCKNCGKKIDDKSLFCGYCGTKIGAENYNLLISRPGSVMGFAIEIHANVDGEFFDLPAGKEIKLQLNNGRHVIKYKVWNRREKEVVLNVEEDKKYSIIFVYDALWGGFKISKKSCLE